MSEKPVSNESVTDIIKKVQNHSRVIKIKENRQEHFSFSAVEEEDVYREIDSLDASNSIQQKDIPVKIIKANHDIFSEFITHNLNKGVSTAKFPDFLKVPTLNKFLRKNVELIKKITGLSACYL